MYPFNSNQEPYLFWMKWNSPLTSSTAIDIKGYALNTGVVSDSQMGNNRVARVLIDGSGNY